MQVVWFKRDLRVDDHEALAQASRIGPVLLLYVVEPELWQQPDAAARHWDFVAETLAELRGDLADLGQLLIVRMGRVTQVLSDLATCRLIEALWSHDEKGNDWTYRRDREVSAWCRQRGIPWTQVQNHGVFRPLKSRDGWAARWTEFMERPVSSSTQLTPLDIELAPTPIRCDLNLADDPCAHRQFGGRRAGLDSLDSYLISRGKRYRREMSSPIEGSVACSRISPYLAWGAFSMREVKQATDRQRRSMPANARNWRKSLRSYSSRLHWHCHFIQKLEDEPRMESENLNPLYDGLRPREPHADLRSTWSRGETGYPFFDACMRSFSATGWLNFRMRAMVTATASYHLWLDWWARGLHLTRMFSDYEPGIHCSQVQMQSGTTGINTVRTYNPVKQGCDQDPHEQFIRKWVPELAPISDPYIHEPWTAPNAGQIIGFAYPARVFDHLAAVKAARERVWRVRRGDEFRDGSKKIMSKHTSRKSGKRTLKRTGSTEDLAQLSLPRGDAE